ncbi:uncharacterized protein LOC143805314 isoform X1 [Ranitomeya variabilis]|uniref:uncharacterized protein LOC143805314 isoform X1 n=1 Tax=Ranitomeya variabilis TaxID=490064 RepID=UPI0040561C78
MSAALEELLANVRAAALVRGEAWLQEKVAEILTDKGKASDPQDRSPCAKRVRSLGPRSPSTVPRNRRKVSSPGRDPPEVSAGQCPSSEMPCPAENPFTLDTDLRYAPHNFGDEDLRIPVNVASWHRSENGPKSEDVGIVCEEEKKSNDDSGQHYSCPLPNPRTDKAETSHSSSNGKDPDTTHSSNAEEESIELRIERLLQSCSAAIMQDQQEDEPSELTLVSTSDHECDACSGRGSPDPNLITPDTRLLPNIHQHPASASIIVDPKGLYHINQGAQSPPSVSPRSILHSHRRSSGRRRRRSRSTSRASLSPRRIQRSRSSDHSRCSRSSRRSSSSTSSERVSSSSASYGGQSKRHAETQESSHHSRTASQAPSHVASSGVPEPLSSVIPSSPAGCTGTAHSGAIGGGGLPTFDLGCPGDLMPLIRSSIAPSTWKTYGKVWEEWCLLAEGKPVGSSETAQMQVTMVFLSKMYAMGVSGAVARNRMSALAFHFKLRGWPDSTKHFLVSQILKGWRRSSKHGDNRRPISFELLGNLVKATESVCDSKYEAALTSAAFGLAFFGAMRVSEIVPTALNKPGGLRREDILICNDCLRIRIRKSKTDQEGRGTWFPIFAINKDICPLMLILNYMRVRKDGSQFFVHENGIPLVSGQFLAVLRRTLSVVGMPAAEFGTHSFRIGAATEASRAGLFVSEIQRMGG